MDRSIYFSQAQTRSFDIVSGDVDKLISQSSLSTDLLGGNTTLVAGLAATQTSPTANLVVNLAAGRIYQLADIDATSDGAIPQNTNQVLQQGYTPATTVTLSTSGITSGQSRWSLIQCQFSQVDVIRANDPTGGLLYFYNSANPNEPYEGPGNNGQTSYTERKGELILEVINGSAASTGSEVPPNPTSGWTPLYLIDLAYGQTQITTAEMLAAGPSVGTNVPSNYPYMPSLAGLTQSHHDGNPGQAPKIKLASEVQGTLGLGNLPASNTTGGLPVMSLYAGNPNSNVAGNASVNGASDLCWDTTDHLLYICTTTGTTSSAVWTQVVPTSTSNVFTGGTTTGSANAQVLASLTPSTGFSLSNNGQLIVCTAGYTNTGATTLAVTSPSISATAIKKDSGSGLVALSGGEIVVGNSIILSVNTAGSCLVLEAGTPSSLFLLASNNLSDVSNATTALSNLAGAPLASPTFTGTPAAPTAASSTNTTQLATCAMVQAAILANKNYGHSTFTASGTFTSPSNTQSGTVFKITGTGSGAGGSGGNSGTGGGGAGGTFIAYVSGLAASTGYTVTIGAAGSAGSSGGGAGGAGNSTTIVIGATTYTGSGGGAPANANGGPGGAGGGATNGTINITGGGGACGTNSTQIDSGGDGGASYWGGGGYGTNSGAGAAGVAFGSGGSGGSGSSNAGGAGAPGFLVVEWIL